MDVPTIVILYLPHSKVCSTVHEHNSDARDTPKLAGFHLRRGLEATLGVEPTYSIVGRGAYLHYLNGGTLRSVSRNTSLIDTRLLFVNPM